MKKWRLYVGLAGLIAVTAITSAHSQLPSPTVQYPLPCMGWQTCDVCTNYGLSQGGLLEPVQEYASTNPSFNTVIQQGCGCPLLPNITVNDQLRKIVYNGSRCYVANIGGGTTGHAVTVDFTAPGPATFKIPEGVVSLTKVEIWGGGGGGGSGSTTTSGGESAGAGGGGGGYAYLSNLAVTSGGTVSFNVGAGGTGSVAGGSCLAGDDGSATTILNAVANGGKGGMSCGCAHGGKGGTAFGGITNITGGTGTDNNLTIGGTGGKGGGGGGGLGGTNGSNGSTPGGGGGGGSLGTNGGNGANGKVSITYWVN